jgi:hypothetical protein
VFLKNLLLSLSVIGASTLHFANTAYAGRAPLTLANNSPQNVQVRNYSVTSGISPTSIPTYTVPKGLGSPIAMVSGLDKQNLRMHFEAVSTSSTQQYGCSFDIIISYSSSLDEYSTNYKGVPMSFPNETYVPTCTAPESNRSHYLGGFFTIK